MTKAVRLAFSMQRGQFLCRYWSRGDVGPWSVLGAPWNLLAGTSYRTRSLM